MVCPCEYPLVFLDNRHGQNISYISIPEEEFGVIDCIKIPNFEEVEEEGKKYMAVLWKEPQDAITKKYEINGHIVIAGCDFPTEKKGKLKCEEKEMYVVLHPIDEWIEHHIIEIK